MKQDGVLQSSGEILPDTEGQRAQHQTQVPVTNSFLGAKMFREGEVVSTYEGTEIAERKPLPHVGKKRTPRSTNFVNSICGRQTVCTHPRRGSGVRFAEPIHGTKAVFLQKPRKVRLSAPEVSEKSKEEASAATTIPQPRVARAQRKRVIKKEPVGRSTLPKANAQLLLSKVDGSEVDYVRTAMGEVRAELTRHLSALEGRLEARVCCHYSELLETSTHTHPDNCREIDLRCSQTAITGRQVVECLDKVKEKIGDVLKVGKLEAASTEQKRRRWQDKPGSTKTWRVPPKLVCDAGSGRSAARDYVCRAASMRCGPGPWRTKESTKKGDYQHARESPRRPYASRGRPSRPQTQSREG
ncbi:unnamed protein product [Heligmosomoides polygyrus]|uniref:Coiled-coil domain-containing protein 141 n=1 Tax=Heligmosomoides polygyrus TaxID=6339 RepID=A0A183F7N8_HELPZ|nr:unnamed protein product [Heligmosomoides polygyrus]